MPHFRDAYQELTNDGFGVYGLCREQLPANSESKERLSAPFKLICDEKGTLVGALGLDKGEREVQKGVVAISKDGRVLASTIGGPNATLEAMTPVLQTLGILERTPTQEYTGQEYFTRTPTSPTTPTNPREEIGSYFGKFSPVSTSIASLHSYLQQMDITTPTGNWASASGRRPGLTSRTHSWQAQDTFEDFTGDKVCPGCGSNRDMVSGCQCDVATRLQDPTNRVG